jgi:hypothetical protein
MRIIVAFLLIILPSAGFARGAVDRSVIEASSQPGATWCEKLAQAIRASIEYGASYSYVTAAFPPSGNGICMSNPFPDNAPGYAQSIHVKFTTASTLLTQVTIATKGPRVTIEGSGDQMPTIEAVNWPATGEQPIVSMGGGVQSNNNYIRDIDLNCDRLPNCTALVMDGAQNPSQVERVTLANATADGLRVQQTRAATEFIHVVDSWITMAPGSTGNPIDIKGGAQIIIENVVSDAHPTTSCIDGIYIRSTSGGNVTIIGGAVEGCTHELNISAGNAFVDNFSGQPDSATGTTTLVYATAKPYTLINTAWTGNGKFNLMLHDINRGYKVTPTECPSLGFIFVSGASSAANDYGGGCLKTTGQRLSASIRTGGGRIDNVTITGMRSSGHCSAAATNASAAENIASTYISAKATNRITVTHAPIAGMTYDFVCTLQ